MRKNSEGGGKIQLAISLWMLLEPFHWQKVTFRRPPRGANAYFTRTWANACFAGCGSRLSSTRQTECSITISESVNTMTWAMHRTVKSNPTKTYHGATQPNPDTTNPIPICSLPEQSSPVQPGAQSHMHEVELIVPSFRQVPEQTVRENKRIINQSVLQNSPKYTFVQPEILHPPNFSHPHL